MSFRKDRFRFIARYSRSEGVSVEFQKAIQAMLKAYDEIYVVQRNRLNREVVCTATRPVTVWPV